MAQTKRLADSYNTKERWHKNNHNMSAEVWEATLQGVKSYGAYGPRDVLIIVSDESLQGPDIVPRKKGTLTQQDRDSLSSQDIPPDCFGEDAKIMEARFRREAHRFNLLQVESGGTCQYVKDRIQAIMNNTDKPGVILHYIGPGRRNTGDWCFEGGFIEFKDIIEMYMELFHENSKCLEISSDCSYSGRWILACRDFLDQVGVQPCGHSAIKANILLKVRASCRSCEIAHSLLYSTRGRGNDKNTGLLYVRGNGFEIEQGQHTINIDNTVITCKKDKTVKDQCSLPDDYTWQKKCEGERVFLVRGKDHGRKAWHYILVVDDEETIDSFLDMVKSGNIDVADYGQILKSGWGQDPPDEVKKWIEMKYTSTIND